ncbi:MAG: protein TolQ [Pseudomonadota bacterium]
MVNQSPDLSIWALIAGAHFVVQFVMIILLLASIFSWSIIFDKLFRFKTIGRNIKAFEQKFWSGAVLNKLYKDVKNKVNNPLTAVFVAAMQEWEHANSQNLLRSNNLQVNFRQRIMQAMQLSADREFEVFEKNISLLATIGSSAPFIGLFGTVWGIMVSFQSIAASKSTNLAVVAPGIAEALMTTAIGLFAAVPAIIFYNILANKMNHMGGVVDNFIVELHSLITRQLDREGR